MARRISTLASLAVVLCLSQEPVSALDYRDLSFYAPFDDSFRPAIARGDPTPVAGRSKAFLEKGLLGNCLVAGDPEMTLSYAVAGNIDRERGSFATWLKPRNWRLKDDLVHHIFLKIPGRWTFHWDNWSSFSACYWTKKSRPGWWGIGGYPPGQPTPDDWTFMAVTWGDGECVYYHNGKRLKHADGNPPDDCVSWEGQRFYFSDANECWKARKADKEYNKKGLNNQTCFDEVMVFNRPLKAVEVTSLYRKGIRSLPLPLVRIDTVGAAPVIDGRTGRQEWQGSAQVTGFVDVPFGNLTSRNVTARLAYDASNVYVLVEAEATAEPGGFVEIWLAPSGSATPDETHRFRVGADGSKSQSTGASTNSQWKWEAAGSASGRTETTEVSIPLKSLGINPGSTKSFIRECSTSSCWKTSNRVAAWRWRMLMV